MEAYLYEGSESYEGDHFEVDVQAVEDKRAITLLAYKEHSREYNRVLWVLCQVGEVNHAVEDLKHRYYFQELK